MNVKISFNNTFELFKVKTLFELYDIVSQDTSAVLQTAPVNALEKWMGFDVLCSIQAITQPLSGVKTQQLKMNKLKIIIVLREY